MDSQRPFIWNIVSVHCASSSEIQKWTYRQEHQHGTNRGLRCHQDSGFLKAFGFVTTGKSETCDPSVCHARVISHLLNRVVLEDKDHREEDDISNNDEHDSNTTPLQLDDALHTPVCLPRCHGLDALGVGRESGAFGRCTAVGERG
jgi:hypothetical protein